jgi:Arc/MetJ-type ribon-helix-helix transcriptional regulator
MVKERISATIDDGTSKKIEKLIKDKKYRNKSHFIEDAINSLLEKESKK